MSPSNPETGKVSGKAVLAGAPGRAEWGPCSVACGRMLLWEAQCHQAYKSCPDTRASPSALPAPVAHFAQQAAREHSSSPQQPDICSQLSLPPEGLCPGLQQPLPFGSCLGWKGGALHCPSAKGWSWRTWPFGHRICYSSIL